MIIHHHARTWVVISALIATISGTAHAETVTSEAPTASLEEVLVTARKVVESEQRVPIVVTALSEEKLEKQVVLSVQDLQTSVPGLFVSPNSQGGAPTFAIRGAKADNGTSATVAVYIDDVPVVSTLSVANMVYDMQSITTLKGPQGTLFGSNSTGGAIVFRPNKPSDVFEGYGEVGYGNYDRKEFRGMVNLPVNDVLQVRLAGEIVRRDGFIKNLTPSNDNSRLSDDKHESARISVRLKPTESLTNDLVLDYFHLDGQPNEAIPVAFRSRYPFTTFIPSLPPIPVDYAKAGITAPSNPRILSLSPDPTWNKVNNWGAGNTTTYEVNSNFSLKSVIGYRHDYTDSSEQNGGTIYETVDGRTATKSTQWTWEPSFDVTWDDGKLHNKTGVFLSHLTSDNGQAYKVEGLPFDFSGFGPAAAVIGGTVNLFYPLGSNHFNERRFDSEAIYSQTSYKLNDELTATLGARYTWDQGKYQESSRLAFVAPPAFGGTGGLGRWGDFNFGNCNLPALAPYDNVNSTACTGQQKYRSSAPSFTFTLEDQFAPRKMVYGSLRGGYLVGGFNNDANPVTQLIPLTFRPEHVTEAEFGMKSDFDLASRPFRTNAAVFFGTYTDQQRVQNGTTPAGYTFIGVVNAGSSTFWGIDLDLTYEPIDSLLLTASWNHVIAYYTNFDAVLNIPGVAAVADLKGHQESQTPKDEFTGSATLKWPLPGQIGAVSSTLSYFYRSETISHDSPTIAGPVGANEQLTSITTDFSAYDRLPSFGLANFSTDWKGIFGSKVDVNVWVKNLFDRQYYIYGSNQMLQFGYATYTFGDPRTYGMNVRYSFGGAAR